jgi:hypothetical protein
MKNTVVRVTEESASWKNSVYLEVFCFFFPSWLLCLPFFIHQHKTLNMSVSLFRELRKDMLLNTVCNDLCIYQFIQHHTRLFLSIIKGGLYRIIWMQVCFDMTRFKCVAGRDVHKRSWSWERKREWEKGREGERDSN